MYLIVESIYTLQCKGEIQVKFVMLLKINSAHKNNIKPNELKNLVQISEKDVRNLLLISFSPTWFCFRVISKRIRYTIIELSRLYVK